MTMSKSICTAYHEAAHAVIYLHFQIDVEEITLYRGGEGICKVADDLRPTPGQLLAILAGQEAEKLHLAENLDVLSERKSGWKTDLARAGEISLNLGGVTASKMLWRNQQTLSKKTGT